MQQERGTATRMPRREATGRRFAGCLAALASAALASATLASPPAVAASCANESFRASSPQLADCRAYELVSPVDMNGNGIEQAFAVSPDGEAIAYGTINIFGGEAPSSMAGKWIARRGAADWSSATINPPTPGRVPSAYDEPVALAFSADLSTALLGTRYPVDPLDQAPYVSFPESGSADLYQLWPGGRAEWVSHGPTLPETEYIDRALSGASADLSRVFFQTKEPLTPEAAGSTEQNLYERDGAELRTVNLDEGGNLIPGGAATGRGTAAVASFYSGSEYQQGSTAQGQPFDPSAVSRDGSHVVFTAPLEPSGAPRQLYVRIDGARTEEASECRFGACAGGDAPDGAIFLLAKPDGSAVTFYSSDRLVEAAAPAGGIYRYQVGSETLSFLTPLDTGSAGSHHGGVVAASADGAYLYLCEGGSELALYHEGQVQTIAPIPCDAAQAVTGATEPTPARSGQGIAGVAGITQGEPSVTSDAGYLFATTAGPGEIGNGYPNEGHSEVYYYEAVPAQLRCLSCRSGGAPAAADSFLNQSATGIEVPFPTVQSPVTDGIAVRNLTASGGRAFFVSEEALVPADVNGRQDVYEWELAGSGDCATTSAAYDAASGGCLALVSSGDSPGGAVFEGASEEGDDAFFASYASLVPIDSSTELHLYDARVGGGLAAQHAVPPEPCGDEAGCRGGAGAAPIGGTAASAHLSGPGNRRGTGSCGSLGRLVKALRAEAKRASRAADRARGRDQRGKAKRMERRGRRLAARAERLARQDKHCADSNRGAAR